MVSDKLILTGFKQLQIVMPCLTQNSIFSLRFLLLSHLQFFLCENQLTFHYRFVTLKLTLSVSFVNLDLFIVFVMQAVEWQSAGEAASKNSSRIARLGGTVSENFTIFLSVNLGNEDISFLCIAFVCDLLLSSRSKRGFKTFPSQLNQSIMDFDPLCLCVGVVQKGTVQIYMKPVTGISTTLMKEVIILHCRVVYQSNVLPGQWA